MKDEVPKNQNLKHLIKLDIKNYFCQQFFVFKNLHVHKKNIT